MPFRLIFSVLTLSSLLWGNLLYAGLNAFPRRIVMEPSQRTAALTLTHQGTKTSQYRISFIDMGLDKDGSLKALSPEELPENYQSAKKLLRYSPRQITLAPGESQTVRILARRKRNLAAGEYRTYIKFEELPDKQASKNDIEQLTDSDNKTIKITPTVLMGLALPIILYQGEVEASAETQSLTLETLGTNQTVAKFRLIRHGNRSLYGEVVAEQEGEVVGIVKGLALYTPYKEQTFSLTLDPAKLQSGKKLTVSYRGLDRDAGTTFATGEIIVP
ncbi:MAG: hypothetical protein Q9N68_06000 [Gammaproteobacteria bacterium]|nr:hypothetical protein [Gammaproteobacteria bacterium]